MAEFNVRAAIGDKNKISTELFAINADYAIEKIREKNTLYPAGKFDYMSISKWVDAGGDVRELAESCGLTTQAIYNYVELSNSGKRDIRVTGNDNPEIYEVKRLGK